MGHNMFAYCLNNPVCRTDPSGAFSFLEYLEGIIDACWMFLADIIRAAGYPLTATLLSYAASSAYDSYMDTPGGYASELIASDEAFIDHVKQDYIKNSKGRVPYISKKQSYEFAVENGDLGAALHWVDYRYAVYFSRSSQEYIFKVTVEDTFDFTEIENPFTQNSVKAGILWFANDAAVLNEWLGVLDKVKVRIIVEFSVKP